MNTTILLTISLAILAVILFTFSLISKRLKELQQAQKIDATLIEWLKTTPKSIEDLKDTINNTLLASNKNLTDSIASSTKDIHDRLSKATEVIGELKREAGQFTEISRSMKELHDFLKSPKLRGNIGETVLKDLISQILPKNSYSFQHVFKSGERVDAIIKTDSGLLPIDSKFPMESFQRMIAAETKKEKETLKKSFVRGIKKHIQDISIKYILPEEGTLDFALMYIPSESVYYQIVVEEELDEFAWSRRVYPLSPNTFYATLRTILLSYEGKKIEKKAHEVFKMLRALEKDYAKSSDTLATLGTHLTNAYNKYSDVQTTFNQLGQKLSSTKQLTSQIEDDNLIEG